MLKEQMPKDFKAYYSQIGLLKLFKLKEPQEAAEADVSHFFLKEVIKLFFLKKN